MSLLVLSNSRTTDSLRPRRTANSSPLWCCASAACALSRREWLVAALGLPAALLSRGDSLRAQEGTTFTTGVNVVNVLATVRNGKGEIVRDLTVNDFTLEEDGRPQTIRYFSRQANLPLTLGLLIDVSGSQWRLLPEERRTSRAFLRQVLREGKDSAFLIQFAREVELIKDLTSSRAELEAALETLSEPGLRRARPASVPPNNRPLPRRRFGGTSLHDSVYLACDEILKKQAGRKAIIVLSDGVDNSSKIGLSESIETAQRADTLVYSILFADRTGPGFGRGPVYGRRVRVGRRRTPPLSRLDGKGVLERISKETGGDLFEVSGKRPLEEIYRRIDEELRHQYSLGYTSDRPSDGGYRKIRLTVKAKGLTVQARDGYYAG